MRAHREHDEQAALFKWAAYQSCYYPMLRLMYAIPNAARRSMRQGAWMKAEGMKAGVPDICLPWPSGGYHGLYIELKAGNGKATEAQREWITALDSAGYKAVVCYGWAKARQVIETYIRADEMEDAA